MALPLRTDYADGADNPATAMNETNTEVNALAEAVGALPPTIRKPTLVATVTGVGQPVWTVPAGVQQGDTQIVMVSRGGGTLTRASGWNALAENMQNMNYYGHRTDVVAKVVGAVPDTTAGTVDSGNEPTAAWTVLYIRGAGNFYGTYVGEAVRSSNPVVIPEMDPPGAALMLVVGTTLGNVQIPPFGAPYAEGLTKRYHSGANASFMSRWGFVDEYAATRSLTVTDLDRRVWHIRMSGEYNSGYTLNDLLDVDTSATSPQTGDVIVYDTATGLWRPGKGGPEVGVWENNLQTNFVYPATIEVDRQSNPIVFVNGRQATAQIEFTVTSEMLVTNSGDDIGHETGLHIMLVPRVSAVSGSGNPYIEASIVRVSTGLESTLYSAQTTSSPGATGRLYASAAIPHVKVGDVVRIRLYAGTNAPNLSVDWYAIRSFVSKIGHKRNVGRIGLYRDIVRTGALGYYTPTTVLTNAPTNFTQNGGDITREQWLDSGVLQNQNTAPLASECRLADPNPVTDMGIMTTSDSIAGTNAVQIGGVQQAAVLTQVNVPLQYRVDRLWVPVPV